MDQEYLVVRGYFVFCFFKHFILVLIIYMRARFSFFSIADGISIVFLLSAACIECILYNH